MRTSWAVAVAISSLVGASSAFAAPQGSPSTPGQKQGQTPGSQSPSPGTQSPSAGQQKNNPQATANKPYEVTKHIAVINAGLRDGAMNSEMLADISSDKRSYDRTHGEIFIKNIGAAITQAETHLSHLQPFATSPKEKTQVADLNKALTNAKNMLQPMTNQLDDPKAIHDSATKLNKQFNDGMTPLKQVAQEMNAKIKVG